MPQMAPLFWLFLFMFFMLTFFLFIIMNYFMKPLYLYIHIPPKLLTLQKNWKL